ncbi:hypothetical protein EVAR_69292_1 [Eumeta japonica]|uniref:Uncharacterized protein n=1 Tax=Eumeta variegata TaxID=151549 RepID=A0A4C2ADU4_EUMVA|nr:hypothetical protein EVAR_69292_1 [Eumeta japonica]
MQYKNGDRRKVDTDDSGPAFSFHWPALLESSDRASPDLVVTSILDSSIPFSDFILDNPQTLEMDKTENHNDALYSVATTNSNSVIQKMQKNNNRKTTGTTSAIGRTKIETKGTSNQYTAKNVERKYTVNKKSRMINTYSKNTNSITIKPSQYTGSLTERLQLIDNTPVGEDPYQMRESDLREQSPIPKLMLQKTNHGRIKICSCENVSNNTEPTRRIYDPVVLDDSDKGKQNKFNTQHSYICHSNELKRNKKNRTVLVNSPCLDIVKTEPGIDWSIYSSKTNRKIKTSVCDYSYGETSSLHSQNLPSLDTDEFQNLFSSESPLFQTHDITQDDYNAFDVKSTLDKTKRKCGRSSNSMSNNDEVSNLFWCLVS